MSSLYPKALQYAVAGYSIIPLKKDKKPLIASWLDFQKTPATEEVIEGWWTKYPEANIGIVTGAISGITVIDIDTKGETVVDYTIFPKTYTVKTPSGGYHLYYQYDPEIRQTANTYPQFPHVDIRNDGGYVVAAGSVTNYTTKDGLQGGVYKVECHMDLAPFPRDLFITETVKKPRTRLGKKLAEVQKMKEGDGRNSAMCSLLGTLLRGQPKSNYLEVRDSFYAIAKAAVDPLPQSELEAIWNSIGGRAFETAIQVDLMVSEKGIPFPNLENIKQILTKDDDFIGRCVYDEFLGSYMYRPNGQSPYRPLNDSDEITITREISVKYRDFAMINPGTVRMALIEYAKEFAIDSARDFLEKLVWDKVPRLDTWLSETYNVEDSLYHRAVGSNWLKGLVKRATEPGCKFDYVLVLEGRQGAKKSTSLGILGGKWHVETTATPDNKDFFMLLQGNLIIEFSEGETLSRGEIKQLKAIITTQFDKFRAPYERHVQTHPRRCVFAMTTNQTEYLKDETGNRRWLPVATIGEANIEWLRSNRDQLLAEALYRVSVLKETTFEFPSEVEEEQYKRQVTDPNQDRIVDWYWNALTDDHRAKGVTPVMAFQGALGMMSGRFGKRDEVEIVNIYRHVLKLESRRVMVGGTRLTRYYPENAPQNVTGETERALAMSF
jgi:hypothetical protein